MFKIESYIAPLLMGYIDKYVKLRTEDFQLSLWGGDVVLNNLDLRLDVIEEAIQLPIIFKSGHIHELRMHVPWTKLRSEPVVITINTIECILKVRDTGYDNDSTKSSSSGVHRSASQSKLKVKQKPDAPDLPPGYLQSLVNKIINNVNIIVNNLILKFVEDDIVLSINVKSAECYSVNKDWARAFVELSPLDLVLRKVVSFCDLTVCLDKSDASGKIEMYQDPVLYRSSITCRLHTVYDTLHSKFPSVTKLNMFCDKVELTITDTQLPMCIRLVQLCLAIYYGTLGRSDSERGQTDEPVSQEVQRTDSVGAALSPLTDTDVGWGEWAWSFVPQILPEGGEDEEEGGEARAKTKPVSPILTVGIYICKASVTFKLTESIRESIHYGPNKVTFKPLLHLEAEGLGLEILAEGLKFFSVQFGVTSLTLSGQGECVCGQEDSKHPRSSRLLTGGSSLSEPRVLSYTSDSLFDHLSLENQGETTEYVTDFDKHMELCTETFGLDKFGFFWFDYVYMVEIPEGSRHGSKSSMSGDVDDLETCKEKASLRFVFGPGTLNVSSSLVHRVRKFLFCAGNHQYEPYATPMPDRTDDDKAPPSDPQVQAMEEFIPTRTYHLTFVKPVINVLCAEHNHCDVKKRKRPSSAKKSQKTKSSTNSAPSHTQYSLPILRASAERFDLQISLAMYGSKLVSVVSKMAGPSSNLLHHCYSHTQIKLFSFQMGLTRIDSSGTSDSVLTVIPACSGALYKRSLLSPDSWQNLHLPHVEWMAEIPSVTVSTTKPQLLLIAHIVTSWREKNPKPWLLMGNSLLEDTFKPQEGRMAHREPLLEVSVSGLEIKQCSTPVGFSATGTLTSLQVILYADVEGRDCVIPILSAPASTQHLRSPTYFTAEMPPEIPDSRQDWITFTYQVPSSTSTAEVPAVVLAEVTGLTCCLDPMIYQWLLYTPRLKTSSISKPAGDESKIFVDLALANAASPLNQSQMSVHSESSVKDQSDSCLTPTNTRTPTQGQTQPTQAHPNAALSRSGQLHRHTGSASDHQGCPSGEESEDVWGRKCADIFPLVRILQVQVEVGSFCVFMPKSTIIIGDAGMDIAENLRGVYRSGTLPDTLALSLPSLRLHSCGFKPLSVLQEIPIPVLEGTLRGEKLPWSVQVANAAVYTLHKMRRAYPMLKPTDFSCTVAVSSKYSPPTSDLISALGACIHLDMTGIKLCLSAPQVQTVALLLTQVNSVGKELGGFWGTSLSPDGKKPPPEVGEVRADVPPSTSHQTQPKEPSMSGAEAVTTETSEDLSRETSPNHELEIEEVQSSGVRLSFWLQWTLPRFEVLLYGEEKRNKLERCVSVQLEELSMSIDLQEVYSKVKAKVGMAGIRHYVKTLGENSWVLGGNEGLLVSGPSSLPRNIQVVSNKLWTNDSLPSPMGSLYTVSDVVGRDKNHGLLSFTFTRALCKNVKRRMRKLNVELAGLHEDANAHVQDMLANNYRKYISEVCFTLEPCDIVVFKPVVGLIIDVFNYSLPRDSLSSVKLSRQSTKPQLKLGPKPLPSLRGSNSASSVKSSQSASKMPLSSASVPLMYVNISGMRVFMPVVDLTSRSLDLKSSNIQGISSSDDSVHKRTSTQNHDMFLLQFSSLSLNPQAENPLSRCVMEKELYRRALHAGVTQHPGSQLEDRQYQLDLKALTFCSGVWGHFTRRISHPDGTAVNHNPTVQIPAVEWNNLMMPVQKEKDIRVIPLASRFDFKVVLAPAIVYDPQSGVQKTTVNQEPLVVCGHAVEINIISDLDFYLSTSQVNLLHKMAVNISAPSGSGEDSGSAVLTANASHSRGEHHLIDSGVESDASTANTQTQHESRSKTLSVPIGQQTEVVASTKGPTSREITPVDVLLTAGRITCMMYSHKTQTDGVNLSVGKKKSKLAHSKSKRPDRDKKAGVYGGKKSSYIQGWSSCGYLADESSDEFEGNYDPATHLRFMNIHATSDSHSSCDEETGIVIVPFLYSYFSQPHAVISLQPDTQKVELSCYDVMLKGAAVDHIIRVDDHKFLPDCSDYATHWLETRSGSPNLKTGVPASLITVRVTDLLQGPAQISVELERPVKLSASLSKLLQINQFMADSVATWGTDAELGKGNPKTDMSEKTPGNVDAAESFVIGFLSQRVKSVELQTEQVVLYGETLTDQQTPFVLVALSSISADAELRLNDKDQIGEIAANLFAKNIIVKTGFEIKARPLIGPFTVNSDCVVEWGDHSGPYWQPRVTMVMDMGLVTIEIGQEHILCLEMLQEHVTEFLLPEGQGADQPATSSSSHDPVQAPAKMKLSEDFIMNQTRDDLKSGMFQYIVDEGEGLHPNPGEIVFEVESDVGDSAMTWSYQQPRVISHFSVSPVPFNVPEDKTSGSSASSTKILCTLQYWDVMGREFVDYQEFFLSEDKTCLLSLPEVKPHVTDLVVALMWRVVMSGRMDQEGEETGERTSTSSSVQSSSMVLPMSLAACIRVDSCFVPSLIPTLQLSLSVSLIEVHLSHHLQQMGDAIPSKLQPYYADSLAPLDQEFAVIIIDNPGVIISRVQGQQARTSIGISAAAQLDVVEYKFLTRQTVLESTSFHGNLTIIPEDQSLAVDCAVDVEPMLVRLGKGAIHTLDCAVQVFSQMLTDNVGEQAPRVLFNHYIICNDTQQAIRFGQVGTDENICVQSREMNLYSWRTQTMPQRLHLCLDGSKWQWCEPFSVTNHRTFVRRVNTAEQTYTVIIRVKQLSNIHTQVIISGQLMVSSRLSHTLELKMATGPADSTPMTENSVMLGPGATAPSWVLEEGDMRSFRVRLTSIKTMWSQEIFVSGDRMKDTRLVKIPLHDRGSCIHVWCHIYHQIVDKARQTLVLLSPLYVVRSHLPHPVFINIETTKLKSQTQVEAPGQGRELELQCMGGDLTHQLTFQLGPTLPKSSPAVSLSSGLIEQVTRVKLDTVDLNSLCYERSMNKSNGTWPFCSEDGNREMSSLDPSVSVRPGNTSATVTGQGPQPNIDLNVSLLEYWPGCNTLLVTVAPSCLLVNHSGLNLVVMTTEEDSACWEIANGSVLAPPKFQAGLRLGVKDDQGMAVSPPVRLSEEEWSVRRHRSDSSHTLYTDGYVQLSILTTTHGSTQMCMLTVRSRLDQGMRILTVMERYAISNLSPGIQVEVLSYTIPLGHQVCPNHSSEAGSVLNLKLDETSKLLTSPLLYWRVFPWEVNKDEDITFIQYLCLRNGDKAEWACALRVTATENGTRSTVTLPKPLESHTDIHTVPLVVTGHLKDGVTYLVIQEDKAPSFVIHNNCTFPLSFGQALVNSSSSDCTVQEETELCPSIPTVQPCRNTHYTFPYVNSKFPEMYDASSVPRMHLKPLIGSTEEQRWSSSIDVSQEQDRVISMESGLDLKLHVEKVAMLTHVVVETVSKAEISAKEIRSRIKGEEKTVVVSVERPASVPQEEPPVLAGGGSGDGVSPKPGLERLPCLKSLAQSHHQETTSKRNLRISVGVFLRHFCFVMLDESSSEDTVGEILRLSVDNTYVTYYPVTLNKPSSQLTESIKKHCLGLCVGDMQIDNQCFEKGQFDFPVMLVRQVSKTAEIGPVDIDEDFFSLTVIEKHAYLRRCSLIHAQLVQLSSPFSRGLANNSLDVAVQPLCIYIDDCFVYRILKETEALLPTKLSVHRHQPISSRELPSSIFAASVCGAEPAEFRHFSIQPIRLLLSVHASLKVFIASDQTPLTFGKFERAHVFTTGHQLSKTLLMHYVSGAIFRAGLVVGSLDVLGNPTGLVRSVGSGVADLFRLPYAGLTRSPGAFVAGISSGMSSFLRNISAGTISSITNFAASVSRNMDRLSLDNDHFARQEMNRKSRPAGLSHGIKQGLTGFGLSLLGAVAGLADQPIQGALQNQQAESRARATATGIVSGVGKGLMGVVTKPIGGAAEFVSQTGQGFLHSTGLVKLAEQRYRPVEENWTSALNSRTKHLWKILHSLPPGNALIMELAATQYDAADQAMPVILLLTTDILFVLSCEEDGQQQAFTLIQLECVHRMNEPTLITLVWRDSIQYPMKLDPTTDRVAEYIDKSSSFVGLAGLESLGNGNSQSDSEPTSPSTETVTTPRYEFHVDSNYKDMFVTLFEQTKKHQLGQGFLF